MMMRSFYRPILLCSFVSCVAWTAWRSYFQLFAVPLATPCFAQNSPTAAIPAAAGSAPLSTPTQKLVLSGVPNAGKISGTLFRGAQPRSEGYQQLKNLGVGIVVDLHNTGASQDHERHAVESLGLRHVSMPASAIYDPTDAQVVKFLTILRENPDQKVFVHCNLGADRAGVMIAALRIAQQPWTPDQDARVPLPQVSDFHGPLHQLFPAKLLAKSRIYRSKNRSFQGLLLPRHPWLLTALVPPYGLQQDACFIPLTTSISYP